MLKHPTRNPKLKPLFPSLPFFLCQLPNVQTQREGIVRHGVVQIGKTWKNEGQVDVDGDWAKMHARPEAEFRQKKRRVFLDGANGLQIVFLDGVIRLAAQVLQAVEPECDAPGKIIVLIGDAGLHKPAPDRKTRLPVHGVVVVQFALPHAGKETDRTVFVGLVHPHARFPKLVP